MNRGKLFWQVIRPYGRYAYYRLFPRRRPSYFEDSWKYPTHRLADGVVPFPGKPAADAPVFVFFPMNDWHARMQRSQHLAIALAQLGCRCIYVNPNLGLEYRMPYLLDPHSRVSMLPSGVFELHIHLPCEHELAQRFFTPGEVIRVATAVDAFLEAEGIRSATLITSLPIWLDVVTSLRRTRGFKVIYDCHDLLEGFDRVPRSVTRSETELFRACDLVIFTAQSLMDKMIARMPWLAEKTAIVRNGVNVKNFEPRGAESRRLNPVVGYIGALDHWFDIKAVRQAAQTYPKWTFVLVGRVEHRRIFDLQEFPNIRFVGEAPHCDVPKYLQNWDAAMIPFLRTPLTMSTNPIKIYEYFLAGLPVVSARLPEMELFGDLVYLADGPKEFSESIGQAVAENNRSLRMRRVEAARSATWASRAESLLAFAGRGSSPLACESRR